jgi:hypothetical protein
MDLSFSLHSQSLRAQRKRIARIIHLQHPRILIHPLRKDQPCTASQRSRQRLLILGKHDAIHRRLPGSRDAQQRRIHRSRHAEQLCHLFRCHP